jgi:hypothetical protein
MRLGVGFMNNINVDMNLVNTRPFNMSGTDDFKKTINESIEHLVAAEAEQAEKPTK